MGTIRARARPCQVTTISSPWPARCTISENRALASRTETSEGDLDTEGYGEGARFEGMRVM